MKRVTVKSIYGITLALCMIAESVTTPVNVLAREAEPEYAVSEDTGLSATDTSGSFDVYESTETGSADISLSGDADLQDVLYDSVEALGVSDTPESLGASDTTEVEYLDYTIQGDRPSYTVKKTDGTIVTSGMSTSWGSGTYIVDHDVVINDRITINESWDTEWGSTLTGEVRLILCDGCTLQALGGISILDAQALYVYGQQEGTGRFEAYSPNDYSAAIGGYRDRAPRYGDDVDGTGYLFFCGGEVYAEGGKYAPGIGNTKTSYANVFNMTVTGGSVTAIGGEGAGDGIGEGDNTSRNFRFKIYGGKVTAIARADGYGGMINGLKNTGFYAGPEMKVLVGDTVDSVSEPGPSYDKRPRCMIVEPKESHAYKTDYSGWGEGVKYTEKVPAYYAPVTGKVNHTLDNGDDAVRLSSDVPNLLFSDVTADHPVYVSKSAELVLCNGAALRADKGIIVAPDAELKICVDDKGGSITAKGQEFCAGMGGFGSDDEYEGLSPDCGKIYIYGGTIDATGGQGAAGIGGGDKGKGSSYLNIYNAEVTAKGGLGASGIGGGNSGEGGRAVMVSGTVTATGGSGASGIGGGRGADGGFCSAYADATVKATSGYAKGAIGAGMGGSNDNTLSAVGNASVVGGSSASSAEIMKSAQYNVTRPRYMAIGDLAPYREASYSEDSGTVLFETKGCVGYTKIDEGTTELTNGWYAVKNDTDISERITVKGTAKLILYDGVSLNAFKGIAVPENSALVIYGQEEGTGTLSASGSNANLSGIGGGGDVTIHGGTVQAFGVAGCAGIGGNSSGSAGTTVIYGGNVTAAADTDAAGIGGGRGGNGGTTDIYGGLVRAIGSKGAAGIGGGKGGNGGNVFIFGGRVVTESAADASGIGGGSGSGSEGMIHLANGMCILGGSSAEPSEVIDPSKTRNRFMTAMLRPVNYYRAGVSEGGEVTFTKDTCTEYKPAPKSGTVTLDTGWYVLYEDSYPDGRVSVKGDVNLILGDGCSLMAYKGIEVAKGSTLRIYGQDKGTGQIIAAGYSDNAAIGGSTSMTDSGDIYVHGGIIEAEANGTGAGIGGGRFGQGGNVSVYSGSVNGKYYGGEITAEGGSGACGIGGGSGSAAYGSINLYGELAVRGGDDENHLRTLTPPYTARNRYMTVAAPVIHNHRFSYSSDGAVLTATCVAEDCSLEGGSISITILPPAIAVEEGSQDTYATLQGLDRFTEVTGAGITEGDITYRGADGTVYSESKNPPASRGTYLASISFRGAAASVKYTITNGISSVSVPVPSYQKTYGDSPFRLDEAVSDKGAELIYSVTEGEDVINLSKNAQDGYLVTILKTGTAVITVRENTGDEAEDDSAQITVTADLADHPSPRPSDTINASENAQKVGSVSLPADWEWSDADKDTALETGVPVTATAVYKGSDAGCYRSVSVQVTITRAAHTHSPGTPEKKNEKAPTCTEGGSYDLVTVCSTCNAVTETLHITTEPLGHAPEVREENRTEPTCTQPGKHDLITVCTRCGQEISRQTERIEASGHNWSIPQYTWSDDRSEVTAVTVCQNDNTHVMKETVETTVSEGPVSDSDPHTVRRYDARFEEELFAEHFKPFETVIIEPVISLQYETTPYDGTKKMPRVTLMDNDRNVTSSYNVTYSNNVDAGKAVVTASGKSAEGYIYRTVTKEFTITKAKVTLRTDTAKYDKTYGDPPFIPAAVKAFNESGNEIRVPLTYRLSEGGNVIEFDEDDQSAKIKDVGKAVIAVSTAATDNYEEASKTIEITVAKADMPSIRPEAKIYASNECQTVGDVALPSGWSWKEDDGTLEIKEDKKVNAQAIYTGSDAHCYERTDITVAVYGSGHTHVEGTPVKENIIEATCTEGGSYDLVTRCTVKDCNAVISTKKIVTEPLGHEIINRRTGFIEATCTQYGQYDVEITCSRCHETVSKTRVSLNPLGHETEVITENEKSGTCTRPGSHDQKIHCTRCDEIIELEERKVGIAPGHHFENGRCTVCDAVEIKSDNILGGIADQDGEKVIYALTEDPSVKKLKFPAASNAGEVVLAGDTYATERKLTFAGSAVIKSAQPMTLEDMTVEAVNGNGKYQNISVTAAYGDLMVDNVRFTGKKTAFSSPKGNMFIKDITADSLNLKGGKNRILTVDGTAAAVKVTGFGKAVINGTLTVTGSISVQELVIGRNGNLIVEKGAAVTVKKLIKGEGGTITLKSGYKPLKLSGRAEGRIILISDTSLENRQLFASKITELKDVFDVSVISPAEDGRDYEYGLYTKSGKVFLYPYRIEMKGVTYVYWDDVIKEINKAIYAGGKYTVNLLGDINTGKTLKLPAKNKYRSITVNGSGHSLTFTGNGFSLTGDLCLSNITVASTDKLGTYKNWTLKKGSYNLDDGDEYLRLEKVTVK